MLNFRTQLIADPSFHDNIFQIRSIFESLYKDAASRGQPFTMPPCHGVCKTLTKFIHEARAASQPAAGVAAAINSAVSMNKV